MGFKDIFKERLPVFVMSGGQALTKGNGGTTSVNIMKGDSSGQIVAKVPLGGGEYKFRLTNIEWEESHARSAGKTAVGAIAGTAVAGPIGTIAGAAIGAKRKDTSKAFMYVVDEEGIEHKWHIKCDEKLYLKLSGLMG